MYFSFFGATSLSVELVPEGQKFEILSQSCSTKFRFCPLLDHGFVNIF